MARRKNTYNTVMEELMRQYDEAWDRARREEEEHGVVSVEAEQRIEVIELEMEMLQAAV